jgi:ribosomal protein S18 acetylase RimI-like enzyme
MPRTERLSMTKGATMVELVPMSTDEFREYLEEAIRGYAEEKVAAGNWTAEEAHQRSAHEFAELLPQGINTPNQHLFTVVDAARNRVGFIWLAVQDHGGRKRSFIYDLAIHPPFRRRGYGAATLQAIEATARGLGASEIGLHVFAHNTAARALYEKAGYEVTNLNMRKELC